jgi:hypothetical protein
VLGILVPSRQPKKQASKSVGPVSQVCTKLSSQFMNQPQDLPWETLSDFFLIKDDSPWECAYKENIDAADGTLVIGKLKGFCIL